MQANELSGTRALAGDVAASSPTKPPPWRKWRRQPVQLTSTNISRSLPSTFAIFFAAAALSFSLASPTSSDGAQFHGYSTATESTLASGFTGVGLSRPNRAVSGLPQTGCSQYFTGDPVYQTQWVILTSDASNWQELGTGHSCGDANHWYFWGYGVNGVWHVINTEPNATYTGNHIFRIIRLTGNRTEFWIDGVTKGSLTSSAAGTKVQAGLESYYQSATVPGYGMTSLQYQQYASPFPSWSGRDSTQVNSPLCGLWNSDTSRTVGQGAGQC